MLSYSESELFITWSSYSASDSPSIELSENNFESLFAGADNEKAVENSNLRTKDETNETHCRPIKKNDDW